MSEIQAYPKMLYRMGEGNELESCIVQDEDEHKELGKDWKEEPPRPRGRPKAKDNGEE